MKMVNRKQFLQGVAASVICLPGSAASANFAMLQTSSTAALRSWQTLPVGAGGLITGMDITADGTLVARADVFGAYRYDRSAVNPGNAGGLGKWTQLLVPSGFASQSTLINTPFAAGDGVFEIRIAPSNTQVLYMAYIGFVWVSLDQGATWTQTPKTDANFTGNAGTPRLMKYKMAVDPVNSDDCIVVTETAGASETLNGTSGATSTWNAVSGVANNDTNKVGLVAFDPSSGTTSGRTNVCYISVSGTGLYQRLTPAGSWTLIDSTRKQIQCLDVASDGTVYYVESSTGALWKYSGGSGGTFTNITPAAMSSVANIAVHPTVPGTLHAWGNQFAPYSNGSNGGAVLITNHGGTSTGGLFLTSPVTLTATDAPWLATLSNPGSGVATNSTGLSIYDTLDTTKLWVAHSNGVWNLALPIPTTTGSTMHFTSVSAGIEEIDTQCICVPPGSNGKPLLCGQDVSIINANPTLGKFALTQAWNPGVFLNDSFSADYASDLVGSPGFVIGLSDFESAESSASSNNYGAPGSWTKFPTYPGTVGLGSLACATSLEWIWVQSSDSGMWHTINGGTSWSAISGAPAANDGWQHLQFLRRQSVCADRVNIGTFYSQNFGASPGTYVISNSGATLAYHANSIDKGFNSVIKSVPGNNGHLFFTEGNETPGPWPHNIPFYFSHNAGATWTDVSTLSSGVFTVKEAWTFGIGAPMPGHTYPAIYIYGWVNGVVGIWGTYDNCVTWVQLSGQFPLGTLDGVCCMSGDMDIPGRIYIGMFGSGWGVYG